MQTVKWLTLFYTLTFPIRGEAVQNLGMTRIPPSEFVAVEPSKVFKIQFNTDHRLFKDYNLFFSYTMRGFWDRTGLVKSKPFIDINHNPELYYLISPDQIISLDHNSNGVDNEPAGPDQRKNRSRSLNRLYWQSYWQMFGSDFYFSSRFYFPYTSKKSTPYHDYVGYWRTGFQWRQRHIEKGVICYSRGPKGYQFFAQISIDLWSLISARQDEKTQLFYEYFSGYGDYLLDFDKKKDVYRVGLRFLTQGS